MRARRLSKLKQKLLHSDSLPKAGRPRNDQPTRHFNRAVEARRQTMRNLYRTGKTLEEIGVQFGVSRERVRQIIKMNAHGGGQSVKTVMRERERTEKRRQHDEARCFLEFGCSLAEYREINGNANKRAVASPSGIYLNKKKEAAGRRIEWEFTFPTWWKVWQDSGKWAMRGRGKGRYCLARYGDTGPYSPTNARVITNEANAAESFENHPDRGSHRMRLSGELTPRQKEVYDLYVAGKGPKEISKKLGILPGSVALHINKAKHALGIL